MKNKLIVTMGISGSGKSTYVKNLDLDTIIICPDTIRKEINKDVNSQKNGKQVFNLAYERTVHGLKTTNVVFDSTATNTKTRKALLNIAKESNVISELVVFLDSLDPEKCKLRVFEDIKNNIDRSNTSGVAGLHEKMYNSFNQAITIISKESWDEITYVERTPTY